MRTVQAMAQLVRAADCHASDDLADWRFLLDRVEALFRAGSFDGAARFAVAVAAEQAGHHPDVDIRSGRGTVTENDPVMAATISSLAADGGLSSEPLVSMDLEGGASTRGSGSSRWTSRARGATASTWT